ncbi:MAG: hypothetical protein QM621_04530 [Aeromicrobium sp.]|uniref:hypothetical protein n=1 Tax=Aeromicrobium sp. TaxID=1871063 RepID=UPI0039E71E7A
MSPKQGRGSPVERPLKRAEFEIVFITRQAEKGWRDGLATFRNTIVDAWDHLCKQPTQEDGKRVYRMKAELGTGTYEDHEYDRYQYKFPGGGRIWYFVAVADKKSKVAGRVLIEAVHTAHPNETK